MGHQYRYPIPYGQYSYPQQQQQHQSQMPPGPSQQATNICQLCHSQGHYDYQCQFAGDFMARTLKKPSIKADHTATKTLIMGNGQKATMITTTLMGKLFSRGGS